MNKHYNEISIEPEGDGFVTHETDISPSEVEHIGNLERISAKKAKPAGHCQFPKCEDCKDYVSYKGKNYCTVPMVLNKQTWRLTADLIADMRKEIDELKEMVYDEILGKKTAAGTGNYSAEGGVLIDHTGYHKQVVRGRELWCPDGCHIETHEGIDYWVPDLDTETEQ